MEKENTKQDSYWCFNCNKEVKTKEVNDELQCVNCFSTFIEEIESQEDHPSKFKLENKKKENTSNTNMANNTNNNIVRNDVFAVNPNNNRNSSNRNNNPIINSSIIITNAPLNDGIRSIMTNHFGHNNHNDSNYHTFINNINNTTLNVVNNLFNNGSLINNMLEELTFGLDNSTAKPPAAKEEIENLIKEEITVSTIEKFNVLECAICKEDYKIGDVVNKLKCGHYHHYDCILIWLKKQNNCPVCRYELKTDNITYENKKRRLRNDNAHNSSNNNNSSSANIN